MIGRSDHGRQRLPERWRAFVVVFVARDDESYCPCNCETALRHASSTLGESWYGESS